MATGLAWTPVGGDILFIEASREPRHAASMTLTGKLGDVMRESAQAASSWVKAHADDLGIPLDAFRYWDLHVHVPAGAIPKDGPSAGVAMTAALASIYTQPPRPPRRRDDGRDHAARARAAGRRDQREGAGRRAAPASRPSSSRRRTGRTWTRSRTRPSKAWRCKYVKRITEALDLILEKEAMTDPVERFAVSEREKALQSGAAPAGEPIVIASGEEEEDTPAEPVMN